MSTSLSSRPMCCLLFSFISLIQLKACFISTFAHHSVVTSVVGVLVISTTLDCDETRDNPKAADLISLLLLLFFVDKQHPLDVVGLAGGCARVLCNQYRTLIASV